MTKHKRYCNIKTPTRKRYKSLWNGGKVQWEDKILVILKRSDRSGREDLSDEKGQIISRKPKGRENLRIGGKKTEQRIRAIWQYPEIILKGDN